MTETSQRSFILKFLIISLLMHGVIVAGIIYGTSIAPPLLIQRESIMVNLVDLGVEAEISTHEVKEAKFHPEERVVSQDVSRKAMPRRKVTFSVKKSIPAVHEALNMAKPVADPDPEATDKGVKIQKLQHPTPEPHPLQGTEVTRSDSSAAPGLEHSARVVASGGSSARTSNQNISGQEVQKYLDDIRKLIELAKQYPRMARMRGLEGTSFVTFKITVEGSVEEVGIERSSSYQILDEAAIRTVRRAAPFPSFPSDLNAKQLQLSIPLIFEIQ